MTKILIVEDQTLFADAIRSSLEELDMEVLEPCADGAAALEAVRRDRPDLVLMDIGLPGQSGLAAGRQILEAVSTFDRRLPPPGGSSGQVGYS